MSYETVLEQARQLTPEEQRRLRDELVMLNPEVGEAIDVTGDTPFLRFLRTAEPIDPAELDELERVIEEGCEQVDPRGW